MTLVSAGFFSETFAKGPSLLTGGLDFLFGLQKMNSENGQAFLIFMAIFIMIFFAASDIFAMFSTFSSLTSWVLGFGLAIIASATGWISTFSMWAFGAAAAFGAGAIVAIIILTFVAAFAVHLGIGGFAAWAYRRQAGIKAAKGGADVVAAITQLRETARAYEKPK